MTTAITQDQMDQLQVSIETRFDKLVDDIVRFTGMNPTFRQRRQIDDIATGYINEIMTLIRVDLGVTE